MFSQIRSIKAFKEKQFLVGCLFLAAPLPQLVLGASLVSDAFYFSLVPFTIAILVCFKKAFNNISLPFSCKKEKRIHYTFVTILSILFLLMLSITQLVSSPAFSFQALQDFYGIKILSAGIFLWNCIIYLPSLLISVFISVNYLISYSMSISAPANPDSQDSANNFSIKKAMIPIILLTFACLFSTYPGIYMQDDVISVWEEVTENHLFDWHPIGYELFCKVCFYIYKSPFTVNVVQSLAWLLLNYEILKFLSKIQPKGKAARIYTAASIFIFTPFLYLQVMMKDIVYSICLVAFTLQLFILLTKKTGRKTYILLVLSGLGTALFRHAQMIPVMVTLLILLLFCMKKKKEAIRGILASICAILALYTAIVPVLSFRILNATPNPAYATYTAPFAMIGAAAANGVIFDEKDTEILERIMPLEDYAECYSKYYLDDITRSWGKIGDRVWAFADAVENQGLGKELLRINAKLALTHPVIYITALLDASSIIWEIGRPVDSDGEWGVSSLTENYDLITYNSFYSFIKPWTSLTSQLPIYRDLCSRGGFSLFAIIFSAALLILKKRNRELIAIVPIATVSLLLLITTPAQHTRYILQAIECALLIVPYSFFAKQK